MFSQPPQHQDNSESFKKKGTHHTNWPLIGAVAAVALIAAVGVVFLWQMQEKQLGGAGPHCTSYMDNAEGVLKEFSANSTCNVDADCQLARHSMSCESYAVATTDIDNIREKIGSLPQGCPSFECGPPQVKPSCMSGQCVLVDRNEVDSSSDTSVSTGDWQTYRSVKHQFEVHYPERFTMIVSGIDQSNPTHINFRSVDICEKSWKTAWSGDYGDMIKQSSKNYSRSTKIIDGQEFITHFSNFPSAFGYKYSYEARKNDCVSLVFSFSSTGANQPTADQKERFDQILSTLRFVDKEEAESWPGCIDEPEGDPVITSLSPTSGPIGTEIEIKGCNLSGFEGDRNAWIENQEGTRGILYGQPESTSKHIITTLDSRLCQTNNSYSGLPCENWLELTPGSYDIYVVPWGNESNRVTFTIEG